MVLMNRACESLFGTAVRSFREKSCFAQADIFDFSRIRSEDCNASIAASENHSWFMQHLNNTTTKLQSRTTRNFCSICYSAIPIFEK